MGRDSDADYDLIYWSALTSQFVTSLIQGIEKDLKSIPSVAIRTHFD